MKSKIYQPNRKRAHPKILKIGLELSWEVPDTISAAIFHEHDLSKKNYFKVTVSGEGE